MSERARGGQDWNMDIIILNLMRFWNLDAKNAEQ
jgi:hypothetical protein